MYLRQVFISPISLKAENFMAKLCGKSKKGTSAYETREENFGVYILLQCPYACEVMLHARYFTKCPMNILLPSSGYEDGSKNKSNKSHKKE
jgi:hypothetical protein